MDINSSIEVMLRNDAVAAVAHADTLFESVFERRIHNCRPAGLDLNRRRNVEEVRNGSVLRNQTSVSNIDSEADGADAVRAVTEYDEYERAFSSPATPFGKFALLPRSRPQPVEQLSGLSCGPKPKLFLDLARCFYTFTVHHENATIFTETGLSYSSETQKTQASSFDCPGGDQASSSRFV